MGSGRGPARGFGWASRARSRMSARERAAAAGFGLDREGKLVGLARLGGFGPVLVRGLG